MNSNDRREFWVLVAQYNVAREEEAKANAADIVPRIAHGDARREAADALERWVERHGATVLRRMIADEHVVRTYGDTPRAQAEALTALLFYARQLAMVLSTSLPTETGRDAARHIEETLGRDGLDVDDAKLECCSGHICDIDESLKPHVEQADEEAA